MLQPPDESLVAIAQAIQRRERSALETLELHAQRLAQWNPRLNAVVALDLESATARARQADAALARGCLLYTSPSPRD